MSVSVQHGGDSLVNRRIVQPLVAARRRCKSIYLFLHVGPMSFSLVLPLLGAASARVVPPMATLLVMSVVALAYHLFAFLVNDLCDLRLDCTEPLRVEDPLVRGTISPRHTLLLALAQIPIAAIATALLGAGASAYLILAVSFGCVSLYDVYGKRFAIPPITDAIQGVGWSGIVLYGAVLAGGPTMATACAMMLVWTYIMMTNGLHGALRDLPNDFRCRAFTTGIFFGARPNASGTSVSVSGYALLTYAVALQTLAVSSAFFATNALREVRPPYGGRGTVSVIGLAAISCALMAWAIASFHTWRTAKLAGLMHMLVTLGLSILPFALGLEVGALALLIVLATVPVLLLLAYNGFWFEP